MARAVIHLPAFGCWAAWLWLTTFAAAGDWPQFRGPNNSSISHDPPPPVQWSESENVAWKAELPGRGPSSPIVIGRRVFVTCSSGVRQDRLHVLCFDAQDGSRLWERQFWATGRTVTHPATANAAPTPASDGERLVAFYSSNDMICLDLEGNLKWLRGLAYDFPRAGNDVGMSSSPIIIGDTVVAQVESQGVAFAIGIDKETGETRWRIPRPREASWSSPTIMRAEHPTRDVVLLQSLKLISAHDPTTGKELWAYRVDCDGICSPVVADGVVYVASKGMTALRPNSTNKPDVLWNVASMVPDTASPVVAGQCLLTINRAGVLSCARTSDGRVVSRVRLNGEFWGTPVLAQNRLYCLARDGACQVVEISPDGRHAEPVGKGQFDGAIQCSPAVCDGALYARSDQFLWKIASP